MSESPLPAIRGRERLATKGPWQTHWTPDAQGYPKFYIHGMAGDQKRNELEQQANADFIAHAREDIPYLLAEVERLARLLDQRENDIVTALKNSGVDIMCGACMEVAFTSVSTNSHTCSRLAAQAPIECSICAQPVPDAGDLVCVDCYEAPRRELPDPVTVQLSKDDCHTLLGYLVSAEGRRNGPPAALRIRFADALERAALNAATIREFVTIGGLPYVRVSVDGERISRRRTMQLELLEVVAGHPEREQAK